MHFRTFHSIGSVGTGVGGNVFHFTTAAAASAAVPLPASVVGIGGAGGISGLNLSTNNGLDLSLPNYEGLDLSHGVTATATAAANATAAATVVAVGGGGGGGGGGTSKRQRHVQQQQQLVGFVDMKQLGKCVNDQMMT